PVFAGEVAFTISVQIGAGVALSWLVGSFWVVSVLVQSFSICSLMAGVCFIAVSWFNQ
ncbi:hypothetical protein A2U01_0088571, partial [Trifolium medium]|nr:hypothetical protein [Trifolium medium]